MIKITDRIKHDGGYQHIGITKSSDFDKRYSMTKAYEVILRTAAENAKKSD